MAKFGEAMRGLTVFISDIRNCMGTVCVCVCTHKYVLVSASTTFYFAFLCISLGKSKEAERKRINKELANIRSKFKSKHLFPNLPTCHWRNSTCFFVCTTTFFLGSVMPF